MEDILEIAGGFTSQAYADEIRLFRKDNYGYQILKVLSFDSNKDYELQNGDSIEVAPNSKLAKTAIELLGEVDRAGLYEWNENTNLSDVIKNKYIFKDSSDLNYALIRRFRNNSLTEVLSFSPQDVFDGIFDIPLFQKDKIFILSKFDAHSRERVIRPILRELSF